MINKIKLLLITMLIASCDCSGSRTTEYKLCGLPCYPGDPNTLNVGVCKSGIYFCDAVTGVDPVCINYVGPSEEICDNKDNDCDGKTDNIKKNCSSACESGEQICQYGVWSECSAKQPADELCNGLDDDCDGIVDNPEKIPVEFCYEAPQNTLLYGDCHPGVRKCFHGQLSDCQNQQLPEIETCNGKDDDCNGIVDDNFGVKQVYNIVILDVSGSMYDYIDQIKDAFYMWRDNNKNSSQKFALITVPNIRDIRLSMPILDLDFTNIIAFDTFLYSKVSINASVADEPILDALREILDRNNPLFLNIPPNAVKRIIIYSDELPQSYYYIDRVAPNEIAEDLRDNNYQVYTFVKNAEWNPLPAITNGAGFSLTNVTSSIYNNLNLILQEETCQ
jgi:Putative metal-binding motif